MPRGSKIGERRGGREVGTPNRRTVLANRILAIAPEQSKASPSQFVDILVRDQQLPADIRMAIAFEFSPASASRSAAAKSSVDQRPTARPASVRHVPSRTAKLASLGMLLSIAQDTTAHPVQRRKAAAEAAQYFLPKTPGPKRWWNNAPIDEYGFAITPQIAAEYRDLKHKLQSLFESGENNPAAAREMSKMRARVGAILHRLQCPCPTLYKIQHLEADLERLIAFARQRRDKVVLSESEDAQEARCKARVDCLGAGPEVAARQRLQTLNDKERMFRNAFRRPLTRKEQVDLRFLRLLFPPPEPPPGLDQSALDNELDYVLLRDEPLAADGNLYPPNSKLAPPKDEDIIEEFVDVPPYVIGKPNYPGHRWSW